MNKKATKSPKSHKNAMSSWLDEHGKHFLWVSIVCAIVFLISCHMIACVNTSRSLLQEEIDRKTSVLAQCEIFVKSVYDGLTLGMFSEEGLFTEAKKQARWEDSVHSRDASSRWWISFWIPIRNLSGLLLIVFIATYVYYRKRRHL